MDQDKPDTTSRDHRGFLPALFILALAHRLLIVAWTTTIGADGAYYLWTAETAARGDIQGTLVNFSCYHPLYPVLVAILGTPIRNLPAAGYAISVLAGALTAIPLFYLIRAWWNERIARWTVLLYALHPVLSLETSEIMNTGLFIGLFITAIALFVFALRETNRAFYPLAGITAALCHLTRPEGVALWLFFAAAVLVKTVRLLAPGSTDAPGDRRKKRLGFAGGAAATAIVCLTISAPYLFWIHDYSGRWFFTVRPSATRLWDGLRGEGPRSPSTAPVQNAPAASAPAPASPPAVTAPAQPPPAPVAAPAAPSASRAAKPEKTPPPDGGPRAGPPPAGPGFYAMSWKKLLQALYWPLLPFLILGVVFCRRQGGRWRTLAPLGIMAAVVMAPPLILFWLNPSYRPSHRYLLPGAVLLLPWTAAGVTWVLDTVARRLGRAENMASCLTCRILMVMLIAGLLFKSVRPRRPHEASFLDAGSWLRRQEMPPPRRVMSTTEKIPWYGGCRLVLVPENPVKAVETCRREKASFLVIDEASLHQLDPAFRSGLAPPGFERVAAFEPAAAKEGESVWIYRPKE